MSKFFLILDFGSQYTHLIKVALAKLGFDSQILPGDLKVSDQIESRHMGQIAGIILSGGAASVYDGKIDFDKAWLDQRIPILGICYGHQLLAEATGGKVQKGTAEFGRSRLKLHQKDPLFEGLNEQTTVWMSHRDTVISVPPDFEVIASSDYSQIAAFKNPKHIFYGVQFHPEVSHTEGGAQLLENFCRSICGASQGEAWSPKSFIGQASQRIQEAVGESKVILGLSGGVDSLTLAALLRKSLNKEQIVAVYVNTGLMPDETAGEVHAFCQQFDIPLFATEQSERFFNAIREETDPARKGKIIGSEFINVFEEIAQSFGTKLFAQGTIWSDVVESGVTKFSSQIKPHHNVAGLPPKMGLELIEPLRELFKDQVRSVAQELGLPHWAVTRKVFPGPGFAIRVQGIATPEKVNLVRAATKIIEGVIDSTRIRDEIWMAFAILIDVPSLGIKGDQRVNNEHALVIRIVESTNSLTAQFSRKALPYLSEISRRITDELDVGRVIYDITDKPPATIEWQ